MLKPDANVVARIGVDDDRGRGSAGRAAGDVAAGHVFNRVVGGRYAEGVEGGLFDGVDGEFLGVEVISLGLGPERGKRERRLGSLTWKKPCACTAAPNVAVVRRDAFIMVAGRR